MEITIDLPKQTFGSETPESAAAKIKLYAALGLYQSGQLSIGAACELAGVDRFSFLELCKKEGVLLQTQSADELEAELSSLML